MPRAGEREEWVLVILEGVDETSTWTLAKIDAIRRSETATADHVRRRLPRFYSREPIDVIFGQPYCRVANLLEREMAKRQVASRFLRELAAVGVLTESKVGRESLFVEPRLMRLRTEESNGFAAV